MQPIEYVIYCRKSTESEEKQTQSIADQIQRCVEYAEANRLIIKQKPKDFSFETGIDLEKEDADIDNRAVYQKTRHLYIVKEQMSWKTPWLRPKRKHLIQLIKKGEIGGLLSYSPDRQARNMVEGGELIHLVDQNNVDLKYTNFHFEPTASWKMMLGIWFVFSKQYSDKLSEDVRRGNKSAISKGKAFGKTKYGYIVDENDTFHPHPKNFPLMKRAFEMRIYEKKPDREIIKRLNDMGYEKNGPDDPIALTSSSFSRIWRDSFYYGIYERGENWVDLRELWAGYEPLISQEEYEILIDRYNDRTKREVNKKKKDEYDCISPIPEGMLSTKEGWYMLTRYLANPQRFKNKLAELQKTNPDTTYADFIQPNQIRYGAKNRYTGPLEITFDKIEKAVLKKLSHFQINDENYDDYCNFMIKELENMDAIKQREIDAFNLKVNKLRWERTKLMKQSIQREFSKQENEVYQKTVEDLNSQIDAIQLEVSQIITTERNAIVEFSSMANMFKNLYDYYKKWSYVRKSIICNIVFSNIFIDKQKRLTFEVNPWLEVFFESSNVQCSGARTRT